MDDGRDRLAAAHAAMTRLIRSLPADAWSAPTPCEDWDVAGLVGHLVTGERIFGALVTQAQPDRAAIFAAVAGTAVPDLPAAYDAATADLRAAYAAPGAMDRSYVLPIGELTAEQTVALRTVETLTHGWDLTRAVGAAYDVDPALAEWGIAVSRPLLATVPPERPVFGTPQPVADDAPALDRLAALMGRTVT